MPYHSKTLIGVTGNIACGKSTVLRQLRKLGAHTIDADALIHTILRKDGPAYTPVVEEFGPGILADDGEINRRALGMIVFSVDYSLSPQVRFPVALRETRRAYRAVSRRYRRTVVAGSSAGANLLIGINANQDSSNKTSFSETIDLAKWVASSGGTMGGMMEFNINADTDFQFANGIIATLPGSTAARRRSRRG